MQSDVWCLFDLHTWWWWTGTSCTTGTGSKYLEYNPGSELNIILMNNEQWTKEPNENKSWAKDEEKSNNNNKIMHNIAGTRALYTT